MKFSNVCQKTLNCLYLLNHFKFSNFFFRYNFRLTGYLGKIFFLFQAANTIFLLGRFLPSLCFASDPLVLLCYKQADQQALDLVQVKAHDIRALAASKAFYGGVSVDQIMQACHWKAHNTFTNFYLKDLTWSDNDNNMYLGPVVAAQQVLDPSPQTSYPRKEKKGRHIRYNQVFRSLIPGSRYRFTSQDVTGKVIFRRVACNQLNLLD